MRTYARELAFQLIFERLFVFLSFIIDEEFFASLKKEEDIDFAKSIVLNFEKHREEIKDTISSHLIGYEIDRVYKVDLALLCEALTEINYLDTPYKIAINEVVELAKKYSTEKSSKFINGVLSSIIRSNNKNNN